MAGALFCALAFLLLSEPAGARRLPAEQLSAHLVAIAEREWRDWGQPIVDTRDGESRTLQTGATENDRAWRPSKDACNALKRSERAKGCHHREPFDAQWRVQRYWAEGLGLDDQPASDSAELERTTGRAPGRRCSSRI